MTAKALVIAGYGLNCEEETAFAFEQAGFKSQIRHINDLIENPKELDETQVLCIPGGFSYGDDTGSGNAFAQKMRLTLWDHLQKFIGRDTLTIGICNGCQIAVNLGLVPAIDGKYGERQIAVTHNLSARYQCRWIDVAIQDTASPWLVGIDQMHIPVAHGEGRFMMDDETLETLKRNKQIALRYVKRSPLYPPASGGIEASPPPPFTGGQGGEWIPANGEFPYNPNGSMDDIAAMTDPSGRVLAVMPHAERGMFASQRDDYALLKEKARREGRTLEEKSDGMKLFENAARYFSYAK
jgi:phosphoribosylformylglycinamidine (FGAM) synthase-like amidotransferase family enzyme